MGILDYRVNEANNLALGLQGFKEISNEILSAPTGYVFIALMVDADATFSATSLEGDNLSSQLRTAGRVIPGKFSAVEVTDAGVVLGYLGRRVD